MNRSIEASGKTVKDAIQNGLNQLGCSLDEVETSVIDMGSPGLFGMFGKPAKVRLTVKEDDHSFDIEMPVFTLDQPSKGGKREKKKEARREEAKAEVKEEKAEAGPTRPPLDSRPEASRRDRGGRCQRGMAQRGRPEKRPPTAYERRGR